MKGTDNWAVFAGLLMAIGGFILLVVSVFVWPVIFYALPLFILGLVILFTLKQQEYVEPIRKNKKTGGKKKK